MQLKTHQLNLYQIKLTVKKGLSIFILLLLIIGIACALYWFFFLKDFEETEDAYVGGNQVMVSSQVAGNVAKINADNMDKVHAGDILVELDDTNAKLSFEQAKSNLANAVRQIEQLGFTVQQLQSAVHANEISLAQAQGNLARRVQLEKKWVRLIKNLSNTQKKLSSLPKQI